MSISSAAVELSEMLSAPDLKLPFSEARLAVIGAGKMTRLLITHLASRGLEKITIVNRSLGSPQELADQFPDVEVEIKLMDDLWDVIAKSDIVYTATSAVDYIVDKKRLEENGLAGGKPLMLVDIAVPRNVGTDCKEVSFPKSWTKLSQNNSSDANILSLPPPPASASECLRLQCGRPQGRCCQEYCHASKGND